MREGRRERRTETPRTRGRRDPRRDKNTNGRTTDNKKHPSSLAAPQLGVAPGGGCALPPGLFACLFVFLLARKGGGGNARSSFRPAQDGVQFKVMAQDQWVARPRANGGGMGGWGSWWVGGTNCANKFFCERKLRFRSSELNSEFYRSSGPSCLTRSSYLP